MTVSPSPGQPLIVRRAGALGHLTLNRPERINALNLEVIRGFTAALDDFAADPSVEVVLVDGAGERGLCAGGDIKALYDGIVSGAGAGEFFDDEYAMNSAVAHYPKPYVAVMDGITMGGGVGIAGHGSVRVVTGTTQIAMPETAIGLFPDVGALYLLARCPGEVGTHLALTGARVDAGGAIAAGLADYFLERDRIGELVSAAESGAAALRAFRWDPAPADCLAADRAWIDSCYAGDDLAAILRRLDQAAEPAAADAAAVIRRMSPTSLAVTLAALRRAADLDVDGVLAQDLRLTRHFVAEHDLREGIRAQLIDKDRTPAWDPAPPTVLTAEQVERFFR